MGDRYFITGVQIGMLLAFNKIGDKEKVEKLLEDIEQTQFIGTADQFEKQVMPIPNPHGTPIFPGQNPFRGRIQKQKEGAKADERRV